MKKRFDKNKSLDQFLIEMNQALWPSEQALEEQYARRGQAFPTVLKIGLPRVGGTLLTQWAASSGAFYLPSNFLSRFYGAPCTGALITELLRNPSYDYRDEFSDVNRQTGFSSDIGKTSGLLAPHEFWYFWRHRLHLPDVPVENSEFLEKSDLAQFHRSLDALKGIVARPLFLKGHLVNFYLDAFSRSGGNFVYFHLKRDLLDVAQSLYFARLKWHGSDSIWFSHKPREFQEIKHLDPVHQVVGQVYFIERTILEVAETLGDRYLAFDYEQLCKKPAKVHGELLNAVSAFSQSGLEGTGYSGPESFTFSSHPDPELRPYMESALAYFQHKYGFLY